MRFLAGQLNALPLAAALVVLVWLALRTVKGINAATRHVIWWLVLFVAVAIPLVPQREVLVPRLEPAERPLEMTEPIVATFQAPPEHSWYRVENLAAVVVVAGAGFGLARILASFLGVWWMKRRSHFLRQERVRFRGVRILESERLHSPVACGYLRPAVVLPQGWKRAVEAQDLRHVILHELGHLARFDDLGLVIQRAMQAIFWWNPLVWFVTRQLDLEREIACDDWAIAHSPEGARPYASSLTRIVELRLAGEPSLLAPGAGGRASQFSQRIERLLEAGRDAAPRVARIRLGVAAAVLTGLTAVALSLPALFAFEYEGPARREVRPAGGRTGFLAGLAEAGYTHLSVDEIIALKDNGVNGEFIQRINEALGQKLGVPDLVRLRHHNVDFDLARALREAAIAFDIQALTEASDHGVRASHVREALQYKKKLAVREIIRLKDSGVI